LVAIWKSSDQICWYVHRQVSSNLTYCEDLQDESAELCIICYNVQCVLDFPLENTYWKY